MHTKTEPRRRFVHWSVLALAGAALAGAACGGPSSSGGCHYEQWQGRCRLIGVRTTRVVERFPKSFVVVEASYEPVMVGGDRLAPPAFRNETMAVADEEQNLTAHLQRYPEVDCAVLSPVKEPCAPKMSAAVPEFAPAGAAVAAGPVGCGKIEQGVSAPAPADFPMPGPFQFEEGSAELSPEALQVADQAAATIKKDALIECVAIKAKTAPGEDFTLANARAQAVRRLLESKGIDHTRVTVFEATAPSRSAAPDSEQPKPEEQRRVHLTVVVYGGSGGPGVSGVAP